MKFKFLFILFNAIILLSFALIFFMPLPVLGWDTALKFWGQNWPIIVIFFLVLASLDSYFVVNWKLFTFLENDDWEGVLKLLDAKRAKNPILSNQKTKLYINAALMKQRTNDIETLRLAYMDKHSANLPNLALGLGLPLVLQGKTQETRTFFQSLVTKYPKHKDIYWWQWCIGFSQMVDQDWAQAKESLYLAVQDKNTPLLALLSLYLLSNLSAQDTEVGKVLTPLANQLKSKMTEKNWDHHIDVIKEKIVLVIFMNKLVQDARTWLKGWSENTAEPQS